MKTNTARALLIALLLSTVTGKSTATVHAVSAHEDVIVRFLDAFASYDYDTCRSLLTADATIATTRRYRDGPYQHVYQSTDEWLNSVRTSGVTELEGFSVSVHETTSLVHEHGATVVVRFTSSGGSEGRVFQGFGIDTASLIETKNGWRILHYSSFEDFRWSEGAVSIDKN